MSDITKFYPAKCPKCGWKGSSKDCKANQPDECMCPVCFTETVDDQEDTTKCPECGGQLEWNAAVEKVMGFQLGNCAVCGWETKDKEMPDNMARKQAMHRIRELEAENSKLKTAYENRGNLMDMYVQALADISDLPLRPETGEAARQMARDVLAAGNPACVKKEPKGGAA